MKKILKEAMAAFAVVVIISGLFWVLQARGQTKPVQAKPAPKAMTINPKAVVKKPLIDLLPVGDPGNPESYCVRDAQGKLVISIKNLYDGKPSASTTKIEFANNTPRFLATPPIFGRVSGRGTVSLTPILIPLNCFNPDCHFAITADANNQISELNEDNNRAACVCKGKGIDLQPVNPHPELGAAGFCSGQMVGIWVKNNGDADAPQSKMDIVYSRVGDPNASHILTDSITVPPIRRGGMVSVTSHKPKSWRTDQVKFVILVDIDYKIPEYDEKNNTASGLCE